MALPENIFLIQYKCNLHNTSCTRLNYTLPLPYNTLLYRYIRILCRNITELYHTSPLPNKPSLYLTQPYFTRTELYSTLLHHHGTVPCNTLPYHYSAITKLYCTILHHNCAIQNKTLPYQCFMILIQYTNYILLCFIVQ